VPWRKIVNAFRHFVSLVCIAVCWVGFVSRVDAAAPRIGVFYFPGWKDGAIGLAYPKPWEPIKPFPEREPMLGWYDEGQISVMEQQLAWMAAASLKYVVFDYYWAERPIVDHAVKAYLSSKGKSRVGYALMWANHDERPKTKEEYLGMVNDLVKNHFTRPEYLKVDGKPVLMIMVVGNLEAKAKLAGSSSAEFLRALRAAAAQAGLPGVVILGGSGGGAHEVTLSAKRWGYDGYFSYNYHTGVSGRTLGELRNSRSYRELDDDYREHWDWFMKKSDMPYVLPMTSGWDKRPWGGSADKLHDQSLSTVEEFTQHLKAAKHVLTANPDKTLGLGVICCWNEFGEGSYIEPTKAQGTQYIDAVKTVFGP
jgi:hypothetical protein